MQAKKSANIKEFDDGVGVRLFSIAAKRGFRWSEAAEAGKWLSGLGK